LIRLELEDLSDVPDIGEYQVVLKNGDIEVMVLFFRDGVLHRTRGPALVDLNGKCRCEFYIDGQLHKDRDPAVIHGNGLFEFWTEGKRNRQDGPAITNLGVDDQIWVRDEKPCVSLKDISDKHLSNKEATEFFGDGHRLEDDEYWAAGNKLSKREWLKQIRN
jgi:hypothetical protein